MAKCFGAMAIALAAMLTGVGSTMATDDGVSGFVATYQCSLSGLIAKILARDKREERDRFIILSLPGRGASYVQCAFGERDREGLCEASSGYFNIPGRSPISPPFSLARCRNSVFRPPTRMRISRSIITFHRTVPNRMNWPN